MDSELVGKKCLAAVALFGEIAKKKHNVYTTLAEFIKYCIVTENLYSFSIAIIQNSLLTQFGFKIPEKVIKNAIKRLENITRKDGIYYVKTSIKLEENFDAKREKIEESYNKILSAIYTYISNTKKQQLSEQNKLDIYNTFFDLLIKRKSVTNDYSRCINAFIIENDRNEDVIKCLEIIREGALIYLAFQYSPEEYGSNVWKEHMVLYFDTELLFSLYGLNGELYKRILEELFELIKTINKKNQTNGKMIELRYFMEIEQEMNGYFKAAINIVKSGDQTNSLLTTAMSSILNGCQDITQVIGKKVDFFDKLRSLGFEEDKQDYYEDENLFQYNINGDDVFAQIQKEFPYYESQKIDENLKYLNKIAILRRGQNSTRKSSKYFFVTATGVCLNIANTLRNESVPLATTVEYLTEMFWIRLNKNFAEIKLLNSNVVINAQLVIKAQLDIAISEKINELKKNYNENKMASEFGTAYYLEIKNAINCFEPITHENIEQIIEFTNESMSNFIDNYNYEKLESEKTKQENVQLMSTNKELYETNKKITDKLRYFEAEEERKKKIKNIYKYALRIILFVAPIAIIIILMNVYKDRYTIINNVLAIIATLGAVLGILNVTGALSKIKDFIKRK